jgi:hypothetical protein
MPEATDAQLSVAEGVLRAAIRRGHDAFAVDPEFVADGRDNEVPTEWRDDLWQLIRETPNLRWMLDAEARRRAAEVRSSA